MRNDRNTERREKESDTRQTEQGQGMTRKKEQDREKRQNKCVSLRVTEERRCIKRKCPSLFSLYTHTQKHARTCTHPPPFALSAFKKACIQ